MKKKAYSQPCTTLVQTELTAMIAGSLTGTMGAGSGTPEILPGNDNGTTEAGARDNKFFDNYFW